MKARARAALCTRPGGGIMGMKGGRYGEAAAPRGLAWRRRTLGNEKPPTLAPINNLELLQTHGNPGEAEPLYREAFSACRRTLRCEYRDTLARSSSTPTGPTALCPGCSTFSTSPSCSGTRLHLNAAAWGGGHARHMLAQPRAHARQGRGTAVRRCTATSSCADFTAGFTCLSSAGVITGNGAASFTAPAASHANQCGNLPPAPSPTPHANHTLSATS
jgi:hypothetical protein